MNTDKLAAIEAGKQAITAKLMSTLMRVFELQDEDFRQIESDIIRV